MNRIINSSLYGKLLETGRIPRDLVPMITEYGGEYEEIYVGQFGIKGSRDGQFTLPCGIAV